MSAIVRLLFDGSPAAIPRGVGTIVVDAVKLMLRGWFAAHVGKKIFVDVPSGVHRYASASVVFPILVAWTAGSVASAGPTFPFGSAASPITMASIFSPDSGILSTTAGLGVSASKVSARNNVLFSTVTQTEPISSTATFGQGDDGQLTKFLANHVYAKGATAGLGVSCSEVVTGNDNLVSTIALSVPLSCFVVNSREGYDDQSREALSYEIETVRHSRTITYGGWNVYGF
jgi:hypothetical protein